MSLRAQTTGLHPSRQRRGPESLPQLVSTPGPLGSEVGYGSSMLLPAAPRMSPGHEAPRAGLEEGCTPDGVLG